MFVDFLLLKVRVGEGKSYRIVEKFVKIVVIK